MSAQPTIDIEVVYALPDKQSLLSVAVPEQTTAREAARLSGLTDIYADLDIDTASMGIFGKAVDADKHIMAAGERLEIYRPLIADPKQVRKQRAEKIKATKKA